MKKSKKIWTSVMTVVVVLIWVKVIFDFFSLRNNQPQIKQMTPLGKDVTIEQTEKFSYTISGNYRDPFLGTYVTKKNPIKVKKTSPLKDASVIQKPIVWPEITFKGIMTNINSDKSLAILKVNGKDLLLKQGESFQNITVSNLYSDSIVLSQNNQFKTVVK